MISKKDYLEIKEFLRHRVVEINSSENEDRSRQRSKNSKYSLPNADVFGWMPSINICESFDIGDNQIMYVIPLLSFYRFLSQTLPKAICLYPNLFGSNDAKDVIKALYDVSEYNDIGNTKDYQQYLIDNTCCYFLLRDEHTFNNKIFRLDLFRHILANEKGKYDFDGGLMHAFRHCTWEGKKLSSGNGETLMHDLWSLPIILGKAILLNKDADNKSTTSYKDINGRTWHIVYHKDPETKIYYLKTAYVKQ